jgi:hypothetical protein
MLPPRHDLAPDFSGQRILGRGGFVPCLAALDQVRLGRVHALLDFGRQRQRGFERCGRLRVDVQGDTVFDGRVYVAVGIDAKQVPYGSRSSRGNEALTLDRQRIRMSLVTSAATHLKGCLAHLAGGVKQEGDDRVPAHVAGDVLLGVIRTNLFLIDVFLEDEAQDIGIDFVVGAERAFVQMPLVLIEVIEDALEGPVENLNGLPSLLDDVFLEEAAIQIRDAAQQVLEFLGPGLAAQALVEQPQQEVAVKRIELVLAFLLLATLEPVAEVVRIAVQEALPLDEIDEHQAVEHDGRIPLAVGGIINALDDLEETGVLFFELVVEPFGDVFHVESLPRPAGHVHQGQGFLLVEGEGDGLEFLCEGFAGLGTVVGVLTAGGGLARLAFDPLPNLRGLAVVGEDDQVLVGGLDDLLLDLAAQAGAP